MSKLEAERDVAAAVRICSLLDSARAMEEAGNGTSLGQLLGRHVADLLGEIVPVEKASLEIGALSRKKNGNVAEENKRRCKIVAPLMVRGTPAGALTLERSDEAFSESELLAVSAVCRMLSMVIENVRGMDSADRAVQGPRGEPAFDDNMVGDSTAINALRRSIGRVAANDTTVLIVGPTGTGKELVACSLHGQSGRSNGPFVAINCAALTETLLESELFGHEKGAFTGASGTKTGLLEAAQGGTVFLDEIGEMPLTLQPKLLRVMQNRELQRVGGTQTILLDVRVVAATNRDLQAAVRNGTFREDLFYRLSVVTLRTPALRERPEDILPLARYFARQFGNKCGRPKLGIAPSTCRVLETHDWPGNVRELANAIEHAAVLGSGEMILPDDLPPDLLERWAEVSPAKKGMLEQGVTSAKRAIVTRAFEVAGQDHQAAARLLGVHPNYLYRLIRNLDLQLG